MYWGLGASTSSGSCTLRFDTFNGWLFLERPTCSPPFRSATFLARAMKSASYSGLRSSTERRSLTSAVSHGPPCWASGRRPISSIINTVNKVETCSTTVSARAARSEGAAAGAVTHPLTSKEGSVRANFTVILLPMTRLHTPTVHQAEGGGKCGASPGSDVWFSNVFAIGFMGCG